MFFVIDIRKRFKQSLNCPVGNKLNSDTTEGQNVTVYRPEMKHTILLCHPLFSRVAENSVKQFESEIKLHFIELNINFQSLF